MKLLTQNKRRKRKMVIVLGIIAALLTAFVIISFFLFKVNDIQYEGNERYSDEELTHIIFGTKHPNALVYTLFGEKKQIPFVQKYDVEVEWPKKISVTVYEKAIIGYVNYMGSNMYFDKDGIVVENSFIEYEGVPEVKGLKYKSIVLNSKLEVSDEDVFNYILDVTQTFDDYELGVDTIYFDKEYNLTLYIDQVKVIIGNYEYSTERLHELKRISDKLAGLSGTLDLSNYNGDESSIVLKKELKNY